MSTRGVDDPHQFFQQKVAALPAFACLHPFSTSFTMTRK